MLSPRPGVGRGAGDGGAAGDALDEAGDVCGVGARRVGGKLPPHVTTYLMLGMCLFPDDDYTEVAAKVTGSLDRFGCWDAAWATPTAGGITHSSP